MVSLCGTAVAALCGTAVAACTPAVSVPTVALPAEFAASDFRTVVPPGWADLTHDPLAPARINGDGTLLMLLEPAAGSHGVRGHIDVQRLDAAIPPDQLKPYLENAGHNGAQEVGRPQTFMLGGDSGFALTYSVSRPGDAAFEELEMVVDHASRTYDIVFNVSKPDFATDLPSLQVVLARWSWR